MTHTYQHSGSKGTFTSVVLLSGSPRRRELLDFLQPTIQATSLDERAVQESFMARFSDLDFTTRVAQTCCEISMPKSEIELAPDTLYISADTMVIFEGQIFNKPERPEEAETMFRSYFGKTHTVVTSVCLRMQDYLEVFYCTAAISFVPYYPELEPVIQAYLASGSAMDKAGAYGIQDLDPRFVQAIHGDLHTIIGLPVAETARRIYH